MKDFFTEFRNDHRQIRDLVMDSITSIINKEIEMAKALLGKLEDIAGPHFRFEEEALYPKLIPIYGAGYINKLFTDHDMAIARFEQLRSILNKNELNNEEGNTAISMLRGLLPHLSDCEGLTIMLELFDGKRIQKIRKAMDNARTENLGLLTWSNTLRNRKSLTLIN